MPSKITPQINTLTASLNPAWDACDACDAGWMSVECRVIYFYFLSALDAGYQYLDAWNALTTPKICLVQPLYPANPLF